MKVERISLNMSSIVVVKGSWCAGTDRIGTIRMIFTPPPPNTIFAQH
ncbi:MAG: hypothetical protein LBH18_00805 [Spirochaetaceae bacterium]|nr:hypothetical protein [Spirochaetaceae bacterium]